MAWRVTQTGLEVGWWGGFGIGDTAQVVGVGWEASSMVLRAKTAARPERDYHHHQKILPRFLHAHMSMEHMTSNLLRVVGVLKESRSLVSMLLGADFPDHPLFPEFALLVGHHDAVVLQDIDAVHVPVAVAPGDGGGGVGHGRKV